MLKSIKTRPQYRCSWGISIILFFILASPAISNSSYGVLGEGINTTTGKRLGECVEQQNNAPLLSPIESRELFDETNADDFLDFKNQRSSYDLIWIEKREDLSKVFDGEADLSIRGAIGKSNGKVQYAKSLEISNYYLNFIVYIKVRSSPVKIESPQIKQHYKMLSAADFFVSCGDHYINELIFGGDLFLNVSIKTESKEEREILKSEITNSWSSGKFSANIANTINKSIGRR